MADLLYRDEVYAIQGALFEVYKEEGCGFVEGVYQECLEIEFELRNLPALSKPVLPMSYKSRPLTQTYIPDFVYDDRIIIELKAVRALLDEHRAQVMNYLKAGNFRLGLLVNFGNFPGVGIERIAL